MIDRVTRSVYHHKATKIALSTRKLSDQLLGKIIIKIRRLKVGSYSFVYYFRLLDFHVCSFFT